MRALAVLFVGLGIGAYLAGGVRAEPEGVHARLIAAKKDAVVEVKAVLKMKVNHPAGSEEGEFPVEGAGVVVDPSGLVMVSRTIFDPYYYAGPDEQFEGATIDVEPTNLRVVIPGEAKEHPSVLEAKDTGLGLGFLQVEGLGKRTLAALAFGGPAAPDMEQTLYTVLRGAAHYDHAPVCVDLRAVGRILKPRALWALRGEGVDDLRGNDPLFDAEGGLVGVCVHQKAPGDEGDYDCFLVETARVRALVQSALKRAKDAGGADGDDDGK